MIKYVLNDTTDYGLHCGVAESAISEYVQSRARVMGIGILDYDTARIRSAVNKDTTLLATARANYVPYPVNNSWSDEYKSWYETAVAAGKAPGYGLVPESDVQAIIDAELQCIFETIVYPRLIEKQRREAEESNLRSHFSSVESVCKTIYDEGGQSKMYIHTLITLNGRSLVYADRNVFDFGRVISANYEVVEGVCSSLILSAKDHSELGFYIYEESDGWQIVRPLDQDELIAHQLISSYLGFAHVKIRQ